MNCRITEKKLLEIVLNNMPLHSEQCASFDLKKSFKSKVYKLQLFILA